MNMQNVHIGMSLLVHSFKTYIDNNFVYVNASPENSDI